MRNRVIGRSTIKWIATILSTVSLMLVVSICEKHPVARRTIPFEDVRLNEVMNADFLFSRHFKTTLADCTQKCLLTPECFSVNYCESGKCALNSEDAHSENAVLEEAQWCRYMGMNVGGKMNCEEEGVQVFEERNPDRSKCKMAGKQHESYWGEWRHIVEIDTNDEWKKVDKRECILHTARHAPSTCNGKTSEVELMEWYKFVREGKTWLEAKANCEELGGKLFSNLNGTASQLEFLSNKLGSCGWIGGYATSLSLSRWRKVDGGIIPSENIVWAGGEPHEGKMCICNNKLYTDQFEVKMRSFCDLLI